jgi:hypothetical protein
MARELASLKRERAQLRNAVLLACGLARAVCESCGSSRSAEVRPRLTALDDLALDRRRGHRA